MGNEKLNLLLSSLKTESFKIEKAPKELKNKQIDNSQLATTLTDANLPNNLITSNTFKIKPVLFENSKYFDSFFEITIK